MGLYRPYIGFKVQGLGLPKIRSTILGGLIIGAIAF